MLALSPYDSAVTAVPLDLDSSAATSLADKAYVAIRDRLIMLAIRPGDPIDDDALAQDLGVGRTPVREALKRLEVDRLVVSYSRRGTFATGMDISDLLPNIATCADDIALVRSMHTTQFNHLLRAGDVVAIRGKDEALALSELPRGLHILFEDESLLVIEKPAGLLSMASDTDSDLATSSAASPAWPRVRHVTGVRPCAPYGPFLQQRPHAWP